MILVVVVSIKFVIFQIIIIINIRMITKYFDQLLNIGSRMMIVVVVVVVAKFCQVIIIINL